MSRSQGPPVGLRARWSALSGEAVRAPGLGEKLASAGGGTRSLCPSESRAASGRLRLRRGAGGGMGEGVSASCPRPRPRPYNSLPRSLSDSLGLAAGARLSRCLSPTLPSGRLPPERQRRGPCAGRSPARPPSPGGSPSRGELAGAGESGARAPQRAGPARSCGVSRESRQRQWRVAPRRREAGGWRPARGFLAAPAPSGRAPAAAGLLCPDADGRRVLGDREPRWPPPGGGRGQCEASGGREDAAWGWGEPAGTRAPGFPRLRRRRSFVPLDSDPSGTGPRGRRGSPLRPPHTQAGKGERGRRRREFGLQARLQGTEAGDPGGGSRSRYRWGKLPRGRRSRGPGVT